MVYAFFVCILQPVQSSTSFFKPIKWGSYTHSFGLLFGMHFNHIKFWFIMKARVKSKMTSFNTNIRYSWSVLFRVVLLLFSLFCLALVYSFFLVTYLSCILSRPRNKKKICVAFINLCLELFVIFAVLEIITKKYNLS